MDTLERTTVDLTEIRERLEPRRARAWALDRLDALFRSGRVPDPLPDGFKRGNLVTMSVSSPTDAFVRRVAGMWMPWLGKRFERASATGVNVLTRSARGPLKAIWRSYEIEADLGDRLEAFPFRNRVAPGAIDHDVEVFKIDYDFDANPSLLIRRILDELVQIDDGEYLGKILYRWRGGFRPIGYFSLYD